MLFNLILDHESWVFKATVKNKHDDKDTIKVLEKSGNNFQTIVNKIENVVKCKIVESK